MPDGLLEKVPGPTALPLRSAAIGHCDAKNTPRGSRTSAGRPKSGSANATDHWWHEANMRTSSPSPWRVHSWASCGPWPNSFQSQRQSKGPLATAPSPQKVCQRASAETQPRCGVTLDGVKRLVEDTRASTEAGTRRRPGRWEPTHGEQPDQPSSLPGSASSEARRLKHSMQPSKKLLPTLDIGNHSNAGRQLLLEAGAQRTL